MPTKALSTLDIRTLQHPVLYEVNARVLVNECSANLGKKITLGTLPDEMLEEWENRGINAVWLMGAWKTGPVGETIARIYAGLRDDYQRALPDVVDADIISSPFAVKDYAVDEHLGGAAGLSRLRKRLASRGIGLLLDFVPNHTARDHRWVKMHPEFYITGNEGDEIKEPDLYFRTQVKMKDVTFAFGRDPGYPGWTDTAQLDITQSGTRKALVQTLLKIARFCDGVRCDMAMLALSSVFARTWGSRSAPGSEAGREFWGDAISNVRSKHPNFLFIAEAYWNTEWDLQKLGFDFTYDKILYDRLLREGAGSVRDHLRAESAYQVHSLRFVENHDEQRAAAAFGSEQWHWAAATVAATVPGAVLFHEGEFEGRTSRVPLQLRRRKTEKGSARTKAFYDRLLKAITSPPFQHGSWRMLKTRPAWHDNTTWQNYITHCWMSAEEGMRMVVINYAPHAGQCYIDIPLEDVKSPALEFRDLITPAKYTRDVAGLSTKGMFFDLPAYGIHIFEVKPLQRNR
jgi:hypothetical protein